MRDVIFPTGCDVQAKILDCFTSQCRGLIGRPRCCLDIQDAATRYWSECETSRYLGTVLDVYRMAAGCIVTAQHVMSEFTLVMSCASYSSSERIVSDACRGGAGKVPSTPCASRLTHNASFQEANSSISIWHTESCHASRLS